jgi:hypothetical protein
MEESIANAKVLLDDAKKNIFEKGFIDKELLVWAQEVSMKNKYRNMFFGVKDGKFMILPITDLKTPNYEEVKYYAKEEIDLKPHIQSTMKIRIRGGGAVKYIILHPQSVSELRTILTMFS